jgi:hypothetical protein
VQSFGDFQNFHPHLHVLATNGCFYKDAAFMVCPPPDTGELEELFRYEVFKMLKAEGKITDVIIEKMTNWPPARRAYRAYALESTTADSMFITVMPFGHIMKSAARRRKFSSRNLSAFNWAIWHMLQFTTTYDIWHKY